MKCDELKPLVFSINDFAYIDEPAVQKNFENPHEHAVYKATEVDDAIAELKQKLEDAQATAYAESVDAGMRERRLRRALYKACANWAICEIDYWRKCLEHVGDYFDVRTGQDLDVKRCEKMIRNWINSKSKCIKKAEEYK